MKRALLLLFALFLLLPAAWAYHANVTFTSKHGKPFQLYLNGRLINPAISNFVRADNLPAGYHDVEVRMGNYLHVTGVRTRIFLDAGFESSYQVKRSGRSGRIIINKVAKLPLAPVYSAPVPPHRPYQPLPNEYYRIPNNHPDYNNPCANLIDQYALDRLFQSIGSKSFESSKVTIAKQAMSGGSILAEDVKRIMEQFTYESSRVDFAKFAYNYTCDKQNYFIVNDAFQYSSSVEELNRYLSRRPF